MTVTIHLKKPDGSTIGRFPWADRQSIAQIAKQHGIDIPISCGVWHCWVCKCKILAGSQYLKIDKISPPISPLDRKEDGSFKEVFSCIWGITSEAINDKDDHEIILEKQM